MRRAMRRATRQRTTITTLSIVLLLTCAGSLVGQPSQDRALDGAAHGVPTFEEVTGHAFGERITTHAEMVRYLEALAASSPRVTLLEQGTSWEERRLLAAVVTSPERHADLEEIQATAQRLADPRRTQPEEAASLVEDQPAVVWMGGSIHGFELSGSEGLLQVLERLTTRDDEATRAILDRVVTIVDPMLNPDGRDAFAHVNHRRIGRDPNPRRDDWANDFDFWDALAYRTGHYFFDTNRDWFAHTQRETRNRMPTLWAWRPQVVIDAHEMGSDAEFYFDPAANPYGPSFPPFARRWFERFHRAYADAFDAAGFDYMSRERYNYFYPGYTTSWGSYQGAAGMLYEQGSSRGLALHRADETVRTLKNALDQQATAAWAALELAAAERRDLLHDYYEAHRQALADGAEGVRRFLLPPGGDPGHRAELADLLRRNGIEVDALTEAVTLSGVRDRVGRESARRELPTGTLVIETAQPRERLIRALLSQEQPISEQFLAEARERVDRGEGARFYDMTAWSLPLLFNLPAFSTTDDRTLPVERLEAPLLARSLPVPAAPGEAAYAYLIDGRQAATLSALTALRQQGLRASVTLEPFRAAGRDFASGTGVVWVSERDGQPSAVVHPVVRDLAERFRLEVVPVDSGLTDTGPDTPERSFAALGSGDVVPVRTPEVALVAGNPVHAYSFGWTWYVLDRQYEIPLTVRRVASLASTPLDDLNVLVIPDLFSASGLAEELGEPGRERISRWVRDGGTLVVIGDAVDLARKELKLLSLGTWYPEREPPAEGGGEGASTGEAGEGGEVAEEPRRFTVPGAILRAELDPGAWLTAGYVGSIEQAAGPVELPVLVFSDRLLTAPKGPVSPDKQVVARYAGDGRQESAERAVVWSGHAWEESLDRLPGTVFAYVEQVGRGKVVAFSEDPSFRGYWRGADRLLLNAVVLGPSM